MAERLPVAFYKGIAVDEKDGIVGIIENCMEPHLAVLERIACQAALRDIPDICQRYRFAPESRACRRNLDVDDASVLSYTLCLVFVGELPPRAAFF